MKKILAMLLAICMLACLTACGGEEVGGTLSNNGGNVDNTSSEVELSMGLAEGNVYTNDFLGIGFNLPAGFTFYTQEQMNEMNNLATDMLEGDLQEQLENAALIYDMYAISETGSSVNVNLEKIGVVNAVAYSEEDYVEASVGQLETAMGQMGFTNVTSEITSVNFAGKDHAAIELACEVEGMALYETVVCMKVGQYIACVTAASLDASEVDSLLANFYAL